MRSEKVPESPSSALHTMYFCAAGASRSTVFHLMPAGKAAPPRPRRPESRHLLHDGRAAIDAPARARRPAQPSCACVVVRATADR